MKVLLSLAILLTACADPDFVCQNCSSQWSHNHKRLNLYEGKEWIGAVDYP